MIGDWKTLEIDDEDFSLPPDTEVDAVLRRLAREKAARIEASRIGVQFGDSETLGDYL